MFLYATELRCLCWQKWQTAFNWKWDFLCVNNEKVIDLQAAILSLDMTEIWIISVRDSYQARIHPPGFQSLPCSRSTSWRSLSGRFDGAGTPAKPNAMMWQGNKKYDRITRGKKYIRITKSGFYVLFFFSFFLALFSTATYNPASFIRSHVTVHLHTLARVSVNVNGVDPAESLSIQQVLGTILGCCKKATPWKKKRKKEKSRSRGMKLSQFCYFCPICGIWELSRLSFCFVFFRSSTIDGVASDNVLLVVTNPQKAR